MDKAVTGTGKKKKLVVIPQDEKSLHDVLEAVLTTPKPCVRISCEPQKIIVGFHIESRS
jgi:hypothetical protein